MQEGNNGQSSPAKPGERPPLSKKSKTTSSNSDDSQTPHFPGPLFRRLSPTPSTTSSTVSFTDTTTAATTSSSASTSASSDVFSFNFSDRDYVFPSNLGGYSTRRNVSIKSSSSSSSSFSKSQQQPPQLSARSASMPSSFGGGGLTSPPNKSKLRADKDLKALSFQSSLGLVSAPPVASVSSHRDAVIQKSSSLKNSWKVYLVSSFSGSSPSSIF